MYSPEIESRIAHRRRILALLADAWQVSPADIHRWEPGDCICWEVVRGPKADDNLSIVVLSDRDAMEFAMRRILANNERKAANSFGEACDWARRQLAK